MTVTELALLKLAPGTDVSSTSLCANLLKAKQVMEAYSNDLTSDVSRNFPSSNPTHISLPDRPAAQASHQFHFYVQHEDPTLIYVIGSWPSAALHRNSFLPSPENQGLLTLLHSQLSVSSMVHVELQPSQIPFDAPILVIRQHLVRPGDNAGFEEAFDDTKHHLEHFSTRKLAGGWQVEKEEREDGGEKEIFVLFSGWDDVEHHHAFADSDGGKEYAKIVDWIDEGGLEVRHAMRVDLKKDA